MTKPRVPSAAVPPSLAVARRALVLAALALLVGAAAVLIAVLSGSDSEPIDTAPLKEAQAAAETARTEARQAAADAVNAATRAETAAQSSAAADPDDSSAIVAESQAVADLQAQLEELRAEVALARAEARAAADAAGDTSAGDVVDDQAPIDVEQPPTTDADGPPADEEEPPAAEEEPSDVDSADPAEEPSSPDPNDDVTLPGEASDIGPANGAGLVVVGIASNSALNVRDVPIGDVIARLDNELGAASDPGIYVRGPDSADIIATVDLTPGLIATGRTRLLSTSVWHEFTAGTVTGWSSATFLAQVGATDDITAQIVATMGEAPTADTLTDLGRAVAQTMASDQPPSRVVVSQAPVVRDGLGQVTVDVVGLGDDSVRGARLNVFAVPANGDSGPFTLRTVESTTLCHSHRPPNESGLCS